LAHANGENGDAISKILNVLGEKREDEFGTKMKIAKSNFEIRNRISSILATIAKVSVSPPVRDLLSALFHNATVSRRATVENFFKTYSARISERHDAALNETNDVRNRTSQLIDMHFGRANETLMSFLSALDESKSDIRDIDSQVLGDVMRLAMYDKAAIIDKLERKVKQFEDRISNDSSSALNRTRDQVSRLRETLSSAQKEVIGKATETALNNTKRLQSIEDDMYASNEQLRNATIQLQRIFANVSRLRENELSRNSKKFNAIIGDIGANILKSLLDVDQQGLHANTTQNQFRVMQAIIGLVDSLREMNLDGVDFESKLRQQLASKYSDTDSRIMSLSINVNKTFSEVGHLNLNNSIARAKYIDDLISEFGPELDRKENLLLETRAKLDNGLRISGQVFSTAKAAQYSLQGKWMRLSAQTRTKLAALIDMLRHGQLTIEEAIAASRKIDVSDITSAQQAVDMLINGVMAYQGGLHAAFDGIGERMQNVTDYVNKTLDSVGTDLFLKLYGVQNQDLRVKDMITSLTDLANKTSLIGEVQQLQNDIQANQTIISSTLSQISESIDLFESRLNKQENDYENFVQDTINQASKNVTQKGIELRQKLGLPTF
jgi:Mg2+ and Co2+ transporter CorA